MFGKAQDHAGRTKLLIVDDDEKFVRLLRDYLEPFGYQIDTANEGRRGLAMALEGDYAAVILDIMLPGLNGLDLLRELRHKSQVPVIMLTALGDEPDRIAGLEIGAEDYIPKPFSVRELVLRLDVVRRRVSTPKENGARGASAPRRGLAIGPIHVDLEACLVRVGDHEVPLAPLEYRLLVYLMQAEGRVRTREQLLRHVWSYPVDSATRTIETHVKRLRAKLGDAGERVETVRSIGYRMRG